MLRIVLALLVPYLIAALDNGFTRPPMGWSALYGAPFNHVNETIVITAAHALRSSKLVDSGYQYVVLDDWYAQRDNNGTIIGDPQTFPSGMGGTSAAIHALGLKFGVYSAASQRTCGNWSASEWREVQDAKTFADVWKIDYLKYDSCLYNGGITSRVRYTAMSRALNATGRPIFYSVEGWSAENGDWGPEVANMWRSGGDIWPKWDECVLRNLYSNNLAAPYHRVGQGFNDPDMLQPPNSVPGSTSQPGLTGNEAQSQFVLWVVMKSPLMLGVNYAQIADLEKTDADYFNLITNSELLAINQDLSPQATLLGQMPSDAQQHAGSILNVTLQQCDVTRTDQRWTRPASQPTSNMVQLDGSNLCLSVNEAGVVAATACDTASKAQALGVLQPNSQFSLVTAPSGQCITPNGDTTKATACSIPPGSIPPLSLQINTEVWLWDHLTGQIISGLDGSCLTLGNPNVPPTGKWITNNGTLEHEVWGGPLSTPNQWVIVLFNKGLVGEAVTATRQTLAIMGIPEQVSVNIRDLIQKRNLPPLAAHAPLSANVPSHGVQAFLLNIEN